jgi:hypothetical protein
MCLFSEKWVCKQVLNDHKSSLTVFCDGLPRKYLVSQCREDINSLYHFERIPGNIPGAYVSLESEMHYFLFRIICLFSEKWVYKQVLNYHNLLCSLQCKNILICW